MQIVKQLTRATRYTRALLLQSPEWLARTIAMAPEMSLQVDDYNVRYRLDPNERTVTVVSIERLQFSQLA